MVGVGACGVGEGGDHLLSARSPFPADPRLCLAPPASLSCCSLRPSVSPLLVRPTARTPGSALRRDVSSTKSAVCVCVCGCVWVGGWGVTKEG